jgi:hypothetical protein
VANDLRAELLALREERGQLTAQIVLDAARDEGSPLHAVFLWDDGEAAERYRLQQAGALVRSMKIAYRRPNGDTARVREFYSVSRPEAGTSSYEPVGEILADPLKTKIVMRQMERDWHSLQARYERFDEFRQMVAQDLKLGQTG